MTSTDSRHNLVREDAEEPDRASVRLSRSPSDPPLPVSDTYRLIRRLGSGSMAVVYEAEHVRLGKRVAIKMLRPEAVQWPGALRRFEREARALAAISNDHVVTVFDSAVTEDGTPFLVMELLAGEDLRRLLGRPDAITPRRAVNLVIDACRGVAAVHRAGIVHRDLKPANLFITRTANGADRCKVLDLGVAKVLATETTKQGVVLGTLRYMAPEQLVDGASVGPAADIYALGAILYECLARTPPHAARAEPELMFSILNIKPPPPSSLVPGLPRELVAVVMRALEREPTNRFASADTLLAALQATLGGSDARARTSEDTLLDERPSRITGARWRSPRSVRTPVFGALALATVTCFAQLRSDHVPPSAPSSGCLQPVVAAASTPSAGPASASDKTSATSARRTDETSAGSAHATAVEVQATAPVRLQPAVRPPKPRQRVDLAQTTKPAAEPEFDLANPYSELPKTMELAR